MNSWEIQAYQKVDKKTFQMYDVSLVIVDAETEKEALDEARKMLKRKLYRVARVWKKQEDSLHDEMHMTDLEIRTKLLKMMEGHSH